MAKPRKRPRLASEQSEGSEEEETPVELTEEPSVDLAEEESTEEAAPEPKPVEAMVSEQPSPAAAVLSTTAKTMVAAPAKQKLLRVVPRSSITRFRHGRNWYSCTKDVAVDLPPSVVEHLKEQGVL